MLQWLAAVVRRKICEALDVREVQADGVLREIKLVIPASGRGYLRVVVGREGAATCEQRLSKVAQRYGWRVTQGQEVPDKPLAEALKPARIGYQKDIKIVQINMQGMKTKRGRLDLDLQTEGNIGVCAIQETRHMEGRGWPLKAPAYTVYEQFMERHETFENGIRSVSYNGTVGVALLVSDSLWSQPIICTSPYVAAALVADDAEAVKTVYMSVYISTGNAYHIRSRTQVEQEIRRVEKKHAGRRMVVMGDFNNDVEGMKRWIRKADLEFTLAPIRGSAVTRCPKGQVGRALDHVLVSNRHLHTLTGAEVKPHWTKSDHWPVMVRAVGELREQKEGTRPRIVRFRDASKWWTQDDVFKVRAAAKAALVREVTGHNNFRTIRPLPRDPTRAQLDKAATTLTRVAMAVGTATGITTDLPQKPVYQRKASVQLRKMHEQYRYWRAQAVREERDRMEQQGTEVRPTGVSVADVVADVAEETMSRGIRRERRRGWDAYVTGKIATAPQNNRDYWRTLVSLKPGGRHKVWQEVEDPANPGTMASAPADIVRVWKQRYELLLSDKRGMSPEEMRGHWQAVTQGWTRRKPLTGLLDDFTFPAMMNAIQATKPGKSPGPDGIVGDFWRLLLDAEMPMMDVPFTMAGHGVAYKPDLMSDPGGPRAAEYIPGGGAPMPTGDYIACPKGRSRIPAEERPRTAMGAAIYQVLRGVYNAAHIPQAWERSLLVTIPKGGADLTQLSNYRGISLMASALKIMATAVLQHLAPALERAGLICPEQSGFRAREECVAQGTAVYEAVRRRMEAGESTLLIFIDFQTAFDTVPHDGLMAKLEAIGVEGPTLAFIKALYKQSKVAIRFQDGTTTTDISLGQGVRQGCPLSPELFKVYINDLVAMIRATHDHEFGVTVPGVVGKVVGGLFADDLVLLAAKPEHVTSGLQHLGSWADKNFMRTGHKKCGVMIATKNGEAREEWEAELASQESRWIQGDSIPIVRSYPYLGLVFDENLSMETIVAERLKKMRAAMASVKHILTNNCIPASARMQVINATVAPVALYGAELYGGNKKIVAKMQSVLDLGTRYVLGTRGIGRAIPMNAAMHELGSTPLYVAAQARIERMLTASAGKPTLIGRMVKPNTKQRSSTWQKRAINAAARNQAARRAHKVVPESDSPKDVARATKIALKADLDAKDKTKAGARYRGAEFAATRLTQCAALWLPQVGAGLNALMKTRIGVLVVGAVAARYDKTALNECPFCDIRTPETYEHLFLECPRWEPERHRYMGSLIEEANDALREHGEAAIRQNTLDLLLGGRVGNARVVRWMWLRQPSTHNCDAGQEREEEELAPDEWCTQPPMYRVASFLADVLQVRYKLHPWKQDRGRAAALGTAGRIAAQTSGVGVDGGAGVQVWRDLEDNSDADLELTQYAEILEELRANDGVAFAPSESREMDEGEVEEQTLTRASGGQQAARRAYASLFASSSDSDEDGNRREEEQE
jgi:exonuclease III